MKDSTACPSSGLSQSQGQILVALARNTLMEKFNRKIPEETSKILPDQLEDGALKIISGVFVTLKIGGQLRGCIGNLEGCAPLIEAVRRNALNAAFHDPRFSPLTNRELDRISIEVSVLSEPQPVVYADTADLIARLRPNIDGVIIRRGSASATFLPQVWKQLPEPASFLSHLCDKAGLSPEQWRQGGVEVETYQVQYFGETR